MLVLHDPGTLTHQTVELLGARLIPALESPARMNAILDALKGSDHTVRSIDSAGPSHTELTKKLLSTHDLGYLEHLEHSHQEWVEAGHIEKHESVLPECFPTFSITRSILPETSNHALKPPKDVFARSGYYAFDMSTGIMSETYYAARCSANLASHAVSLLISDADLSVVMALCRPPGHHCDTTKAGGYCYLNNCVVAVESVIRDIAKSGNFVHDNEIVILDLDFHHGNGTQSFFYDRQVRYISLHGKDEYPYYSGDRMESGTGIGLGYNHNFPLPQKCSLDVYLRTLDQALEIGFCAKVKFLILSLGFDTFALDPLGSFDLQTADYVLISRHISTFVQRQQIQTVILLEGGYVVDKLGANLIAFMDGWQV